MSADEEPRSDTAELAERRARIAENYKRHREGLGDEGRRIVGERPRPRTLVWIEDGELRDEIASAELFPTTQIVDGGSRSQVNDREWDLLVTDQSLRSSVYTPGWEPHKRMSIISFKGEPNAGLGLVERRPNSDGSREPATFGRWEWATPATQFAVPGGLPSSLERLVESDLLPPIREAGEAVHLGRGTDGLRLEALLLTKIDDLVLAAFLQRKDGMAEILALPPTVSRHSDWIVAAMRRWRSRWPDIFQHLPHWRSDPEWATTTERDVLRQIELLESEDRERIKVFDAQRAQLKDALAKARAVGDKGQRRLLTEASSGLVEAVATALRALGFEVEVGDVETEPGRAMEDLRLKDPHDAEWTSLVEVRGYRGGASPKDLLRLTRFAIEYSTRTRKQPSALWYVVNQFVGQDPEARPPILHNEDATLEASADEHGLVALDTADLFRITVAVGESRLDKDAVRQRLRTHAGRFTLADAEAGEDPSSR